MSGERRFAALFLLLGLPLPLCGTGMTKTVIAQGYFHKPIDPLSVSL
jgi:hypothetical protein